MPPSRSAGDVPSATAVPPTADRTDPSVIPTPSPEDHHGASMKGGDSKALFKVIELQ